MENNNTNLVAGTMTDEEAEKTLVSEGGSSDNQNTNSDNLDVVTNTEGNKDNLDVQTNKNESKDNLDVPTGKDGKSNDNTTNTTEETKSLGDTVEETTATAINSATQATAPNTRTDSQIEVKIAEDGTMSIDGKTATNEQLQSYFDYSKYDDSTSAKMVEGIFKSDTVTINGVAYKAELNANGEMVSLDGKTKLTQEEIKSYFGDKGYEALICKTTKDVSVDEDGKVTIKDKEDKVDIKITSPDTGINKSNSASNFSDIVSNKSTQSKIKSPSGGSSGGSSGGGGGGGSRSGGGGGGGSSSGGGGGTSSGGSSSGGGKTDEVEAASTPVIMVDFGALEGIRDGLQSLSSQLQEVSDGYTATVNGLAGDTSAWAGMDKDAYIQQKKGYSTSVGQVAGTLNSFVSYLDTCLTNYQQLESTLAAKQIS